MKPAYELSCFKHLEYLGQGGTAKVVKVFSKKYNKLAALKFPLENIDNQNVNFSQLAKREYKLIGDIKYTGIARIIEYEAKEPQYLLLELCQGPTLEKVGKIENLHAALNILSAIAVNLEFIQAKGIIHGDLKPDNIFLPANIETLANDRLFYVKFSDFSLGRFNEEPDNIRAGLGTVGYMAPETIVDSRVSFSSDIFALGIIAYQVLTGQHPFIDDNHDPVKTNSRIREEQPTPIEKLRPELNNDIINLVNQLMLKDENQRPVSGWDICYAFEKAGATYPFEKALRPAYFLSSKNSYSENVSTLLSLNDNEPVTLNQFTDHNNIKLRFLLTANFIRNNLIYKNQRFSFIKGVYLPNILRKNALRFYKLASWIEKKSIIKTALAGNIDNAVKLGIITNGYLKQIPSILFFMLLQFLKPSTIKRLSLPLAIQANQQKQYEIAASLYLSAGMFDDARRCACQTAKLLNKKNKNDEAIQILTKVINYGRMIRQESTIREPLLILGDILKETGEAEEALLTYNEIVDIYENLAPDKLLAETYKNLGDLYKIKQYFKEGIEALDNALTIYENLNEELEISHIFNNMGNLYFVASDFPSAIKYYRKAIKIQKHLSAKEDLASTLNNLGSTLAVGGRFKRATNILNLSLQLKKEIGNQGEIARTLNNLGFTCCQIGAHDKAVSSLMESLEINKKIGSKKEILFNLENLTSIMITAGQLKKSISYLKEGITLADELDDEPHFGILNVSMGKVLTYMGRFSDAQICFNLVTDIVKKIDDRLLEISVAVEIAHLCYVLGDDKQALQISKDAYEKAKDVSGKTSQLNALLIITRITGEEGYLDNGLALAEELHLNREKVILNFNHLDLIIQSKKVKQAKTLFNKISTELDNISDDIELARFYNIAAEHYILQNNPDTAASFLKKAQNVAKQSSIMPEMIKTLSLSGQLQFSLKEYEQCYNNYKKAFQIAKKIADNIESNEQRRLFQNQRSIKFLIVEIGRLGKLIGKKRAGITPAL